MSMTTIDELNGVFHILVMSLGQLSKVVMQPFHPEGSEKSHKISLGLLALDFSFANANKQSQQ